MSMPPRRRGPEYWRMYSYVTAELPRVLAENFPIDPKRQGIFGHSMGGHGALVAALRNPGQISFSVGVRADRGAEPLALGPARPSAAISARIAASGAPTTPASWCSATRLSTTILIDQGLDDPLPR